MNSVFGLINLLEYKEENPEPLELAGEKNQDNFENKKKKKNERLDRTQTMMTTIVELEKNDFIFSKFAQYGCVFMAFYCVTKSPGN